jgi:single-strand DNA-binding protein
MKRLSPVSLPCLSGHTLRACSGARRHVAALLSGLLSQNKFGSLLQKARLGTWEPGLSLRLRQWVTRPIREFNIGDFNMYQNRISLIGFLGKDATAVSTNNANFTALSLATKSSYKDKTTGKYIDHTEWHRCIVWGNLAEYAKTLKKGAHLSVEGELRSRERTDKKTGQKERVWEVRVASILKLDRAEKASPEEQADDELNPEDEAA